jgi:formylglycine-generating enzyme required for sulfatase activity
MSSPKAKPPQVFISYSHDSHVQLDRVLALADRLRAEGIDCNLDQYEPAPAETWPRWMEDQFRAADFILVVCTETYCRRFEGREAHGVGLGVKWEGAIITRELYRDETLNHRFIPILFTADDAVHVPEMLRDYMRYVVTNEPEYELLYRRLTNQPRVVRPPLGQRRNLEPVNKLRALPEEERQQEFAAIEPEPAAPPVRRPAASVPPPVVSAPAASFTEGLKGAKLEMVYLPGGAFQMGSNESSDEEPIHRVTLSPFCIGKYPVTQAQWQAVMRNNPSNFKGADLPVESVSWVDATAFCAKLSRQSGKNYRLPTEAEWEYACRADSSGKWCFGDDLTRFEEYAWYYENSDSKTHPVGQRKPNAWGLYDMHGNVWEWCQDLYDGSYYSNSPAQDPQGPTQGSSRVVRGGSWGGNGDYCRSAFRNYHSPGLASIGLGFRVVRVARTS